MTAPTYPRIDPHNPRIVQPAAGSGFCCASQYEAQLALNALNAAFNAGMRYAIDQMKEQNDEADA